MTLPPPSEHFQGKTVVEHLREARARGAMASAEIHGTEMPGHLSAGADAGKEMAILVLILWTAASHFLMPQKLWLLLLPTCAGWIIWKTARAALLGWARMQRLHRVIEEERWEIEHHRQQEKEELREIYLAKGLSGKLLEEVVEVLMADDNRLLRVMLEEELGLTLEVDEHPLKIAFGALVGSFLSASVCLFGFWLDPTFGLPLVAALSITSCSVLSARLEKNRSWDTIIWNLSVCGLIAGAVYFLIPLFLQ